MQKMQEIRERIDVIDAQLVELFQERMKCASEMAEYKRGKNMAIYDKAREESKLETLSNMVEDKFMKRSVREIFTQFMSISRKYQYQLLKARDRYIENYFHQVDELEMYDDTRVVYQGVPGAYQQMAVEKFFGADIDHYHVQTFNDVASP